MNELFSRRPAISEPTPVRFTLRDVEAMLEAGVFGPDDKFELIDGVLVWMSPNKNKHEFAKRELIAALYRRLPDTLIIGVEQTVYLAEDSFVNPDLVLSRRDIPPEDLQAPDALMIVEVADTSLNQDLNRKAALYARYGAPLYWVVDVNARETVVHTEPSAEGYGSIVRKPFDAALNVPVEPGWVLRLAEFVPNS
ncbi:MAG: Uma2 family endonuclease [Maricaulaceae bacterium]